MPFRTKDFLLLLLTIAFLVVGIASTVRSDLAAQNQPASVSMFTPVTPEEVIYAAVLSEKVEATRASRLATLRKKISDFVLPESKEEVVPEPLVTEEVTLSATRPGEIDTCAGYTTVTRAWSATDLEFEIVEGARIVYRSLPEVATSNVPVSTSTLLYPPTREVLLQLPLRTAPLAIKSCIGTDVIGIALEGSLIRNNEHGVYKIFGQETLLGYALDGFAIYGLSNNIKTDNCGGAVVNGEYRYYLSEDRLGVLGCFGGVPVNL